ncbi:MAG TPA: hypothetical protein VD995_26670 [Azospirillum sp.]|nr:hypothetical protein [Azospirillum sp.]
MANGTNALTLRATLQRAAGRIAPWACAVLLLLPAGLATIGDTLAQTQSNVRQTKHNLSTNAPAGNAVKSTNVDQVCVFCHTPHAATMQGGQPVGPLWNRQLSSSQYTTYASKSLDALPMGAVGLDQPGGSSKLCLSCHDGTIAIGQVGVLNGKASPSVTMSGAAPDGGMPNGQGGSTGFTRRLGTDLTNDHPISFTYDDTLATKDGDLRKPSESGGNPRLIDSRAVGYHPTLPLENGQMQCTTCHDPHLYDPADANRKFLRLNRLQKNAGPTTTFNVSNDIICLACHPKEGYVESAHADPTVANEVFTNTAAADRGFPVGTQVWQASCLACHDTHTVQGSRRLLREGTDGADDGSGHRSGGKSATEETCYQCHSKDGVFGKLVLQNQDQAGFEVPNIKTDFEAAGNTHMPIRTAGAETHDIGDSPLAQAGKDFIEKPDLLGIANRHVECTDCHNPHRVRKNKKFDGSGTTASGTHEHSGTTVHSNVISGVLRGTWGVEPRYASDIANAFGNNPTGFDVKRGDPGPSVSTDVSEPYVTREYQICLKCHSNYAYGTTPPNLGSADGSTADYGFTDTGGVRIHAYTNQAMEFQAPSDDAGETTANHRSWHPVMKATGRTTGLRKADATNWTKPFSNAVGSQTMYCSDCHGNAVSAIGTAVPTGNSTNENGNPWGPHGSSNKFILKGNWNNNTGEANTDGLCFKCHDREIYAQWTDRSRTARSGFGTTSVSNATNLHGYHADKVANFRCSYCHVAVPHGWKNKALLADLNNIGAEVGLSNYKFPQQYLGSDPNAQKANRYYRAPYYMGALLKVRNWAKSGVWAANDCGNSGTTDDKQYGKTWMQNTCKNIP